MHFLRPTLSSKFRFFRGCKVDGFLPKFLSDRQPGSFVCEKDVLPRPHPSPQPFLDSIDDAPKGGRDDRVKQLELLDIALQVGYVSIEIKNTGNRSRMWAIRIQVQVENGTPGFAM
jgi:hypothetical protein